ncbi:MAG: nickel pincer cofactor biosynthesis protein LarC [Kiritimatiellia bacterium]
MKTLRFNSSGGASGDMILACFFDLGVDKDAVETALKSLSIEEFHIHHDRVNRNGLKGSSVRVETSESHSHRKLRDIRGIVGNSSLPETVKESCMRVFRRLAEAEARAHDTSPEEVHFHEVGALDSIVDIAGSCFALDSLGVKTVSAGPLPLGNGVINSRHGPLPVPVPATVELLKGRRVYHTEEQAELVTPTGAALLSTWCDGPEPSGGTLIKTGLGFGRRELSSRPNALRAILMETAPDPEDGPDCLVLECTIDDTTPELIGSMCGRLLENGALETFTTPVQMKKQRPGVLLTVLCRPRDRETMLETVFGESTTFGIREYISRRTVLARRFVKVQTPYGEVNVKTGSWQGKDITSLPEYDDCARLAVAAGVPARAVYEAASAAVHALGEKNE